jgi:hypothetical protein
LAILGHGLLERGDQCAWIFHSWKRALGISSAKQRFARQTGIPKKTTTIIFKRKNTIFKQRNALQPKVYIGLTTDILSH